MSRILYWKPIKVPTNALGYGLTKVILEKYNTNKFPILLTNDDIDYLEGIRAVGDGEIKEDADRLINAIRKCDTVELTLV